MKAFDIVNLARHKDRHTASEYINNIFEEFTELHGDRRFGDDGAVIGGLAFLAGMPVTVIGIEKGKDLKERLKKNFGSANPEGYRKALRLFKQAEKFNRPVICFIDPPSAFPGISAEERGQGQAIAENISEMMALKVPSLSIVTGEGGSGGALALAVTDEVWMLENSIYSVIPPEGCASILWKDSKKVREASECLKLTAQDLSSLGVIEKIFPETKDFKELCNSLKSNIISLIEKNKALSTDELLENRYQKFRKIGRINI
jgi:acetyl-CoA carboxylase carboxyl transferase subunit alpha